MDTPLSQMERGLMDELLYGFSSPHPGHDDLPNLHAADPSENDKILQSEWPFGMPFGDLDPFISLPSYDSEDVLLNEVLEPTIKTVTTPFKTFIDISKNLMGETPPADEEQDFPHLAGDLEYPSQFQDFSNLDEFGPDPPSDDHQFDKDSGIAVEPVDLGQARAHKRQPSDETAEDLIPKRKRRNDGPVPGNNRFGPRGTRKCPWCRRNHQRCEFEYDEQSCSNCVRRKQQCGPKILNSEKQAWEENSSLFVPNPHMPYPPEFRSVPQASSSLSSDVMTSIAAFQETYHQLRVDHRHDCDEFERRLSERENRFMESQNRFMENLARLLERYKRGNRDVDPVTRNSPEEIPGSRSSRHGLQRFLRISQSITADRLLVQVYLPHDDDIQHSHTSRSRRRWQAAIFAIAFLCTKRMAVATLLLRNHVQNTIVSNHRLFRENSDQLQRFDFEFSVSEWSKIAGFERKAKQRIRDVTEIEDKEAPDEEK